eukprot:jgi/Galph1/2953/GphlegSOOS_G1631.1
MYSPCVYYISYLAPLSAYISIQYPEFGSKWFCVYLIFGVVPILDILSGEDTQNPNMKEEVLYSKNLSYRLPLLLWLFAELLLIERGARKVYQCASFFTWLATLLSVGVCTGMGITCAHELGHKLSKACRSFSKMQLLLACYGIFTVEHNYGHHKNVGTRQDPTTARLNESFYRFLFRALVGVGRDAWRLEMKALKRKGYHGIHLILRNQVVIDSLCSTIIGILFCFIYGWRGSVFFFAQAFIAIILLQLINYIEHYGLVRHRLKDGTYEPINICHSWDAPQKLSNVMQFKLQRHSDHHVDSFRPYQLLRTYAASPKMPFGYPAMMMLSLVPFCFFRIMNPLVVRQVTVEQAKWRSIDETLLEKLQVQVHPKVPDLIKVTTLGPFTRERKGLPAVCVDSFCGEAVLRGADIYASGMIAMESTASLYQLVQIWMDPFGTITRGSTSFDTSNLFYLGNGILKQHRKDIFVNLPFSRGLAIQVTQPVYFAPSLHDHLQSGMALLQNLPCAVVGHVMNPKPGQRVLDLCASPGGKTTHLATLMKNEGIIVALDRNHRKVKRIQHLCEQWDIDIVRSYVMDATRYREYIREYSSSEENAFSDTPPFIRESFDCVLVDPPCSAFGLRPKFSYALKRKDLEKFSKFQKIFLLAAMLLLKPGGYLVYSTCTMDPFENEENVGHCLKQFPVTLVDQPLHIGGTGYSGFGLSASECEKIQRFDLFHEEYDTCEMKSFRRPMVLLSTWKLYFKKTCKSSTSHFTPKQYFASASYGIVDPYDPSLFWKPWYVDMPKRVIASLRDIQAMAVMQKQIGRFKVGAFKEEAVSIYRQVNEAFAAGNKKLLYQHTTPLAFKEFCVALDKRPPLERHVWKFGKLLESQIVRTRVFRWRSGTKKDICAQITLHIGLTRALAVYDGKGQKLYGDPQLFEEIFQYIVFQRSLQRLEDFNWKYVGIIA